MEHVQRVLDSQKELKIIKTEKNAIIVKAKFGPSKETRIPTNIDEDLAFFIAVVIGDGHIRKKKLQIAIELADLELLKEIQITCKRLFNRDFNLGKEKIRIGKKLTRVIHIDSKAIFCLLVKVFNISPGKKSDIVSVPQQIKKSSLIIKKAFLMGIFLTEGGKRHNGYGMSTASKDLQKGIVDLLSEMKIKCNEDKWVHKKYKKTYYGISFKKEHLSQIMRRYRSGQTDMA